MSSASDREGLAKKGNKVPANNIVKIVNACILVYTDLHMISCYTIEYIIASEPIFLFNLLGANTMAESALKEWRIAKHQKARAPQTKKKRIVGTQKTKKHTILLQQFVTIIYNTTLFG